MNTGSEITNLTARLISIDSFGGATRKRQAFLKKRAQAGIRLTLKSCMPDRRAASGLPRYYSKINK